jgi:adenine-specific DNA-methyltransferase
MARPPKPQAGPRPIETLVHADTRRNIPTAEFQSIAQQMEEGAPIKPARYQRATPLAKGETRERNADLDPQIVWRGMRIKLTQAQRKQLQETGEVEPGDAQLVWRGKDTQDWSDLVVNPPPIYIQEKVHPKAIIEGIRKESRARAEAATEAPDLFADFNGLDDPEARLEFYQHDQHWSNRMILGDSLQVMASLVEREGLRGKVQCIYFDPPYGIKFNSNWQVSTQSRDVKDGKREDVSREPEQVKAFRDTWKDGIHSYLTYLRDRLVVARELLTESGSIFVQIGDENVHRVRAVLDEIFGVQNFVSFITAAKTTGAGSPAIGTNVLASVNDFIMWYARDIDAIKYRQIYLQRKLGEEGASQYNFLESPDSATFRRMTLDEQATGQYPAGWKVAAHGDMTSQTGADTTRVPVEFEGGVARPAKGGWKTNEEGTRRLGRAKRFVFIGSTLRYRRRFEDFAAYPINNYWNEFRTSGFSDSKIYVVQTNPGLIARCMLMATDPGDLVLDPTCGSGTTVAVAEQWGRRWITIDTSRVALALARTRLMAARYPYYLLADTREGRAKELTVSGQVQPDTPTNSDVRHGFVYERAPHVTLKSIANNAEIDVLWEDAQQTLEPLRARLDQALGTTWEEWEVPRDPNPKWSAEITKIHAAWWAARIARQKHIDASIARRADIEYLYDRPYEDRSRIRVAGPFSVESLSPHRVVPADEDELFALPSSPGPRRKAATPPVDFAAMVLDHLRTSGVHQTHKADSIHFTSLQPWPGVYIGAEGRFLEGATERRAGILIGPEFGTLSRTDLVTAAREASEARFDVLIACAFNYDAHASELTKLGPLAILKARMNPDLHMADDLKNTGRGNLFVVFGEPDLVVEKVPEQPDHVRIRIIGVDVFDPQTGDIRSGDTKSIAAWFIDTDYNEESFFVRHAYFLGANDPYKSLKAALRAEIDEEAWATLYRDVSRPFHRPETGRIAVKVINHFGDEVMKVFSV